MSMQTPPFGDNVWPSMDVAPPYGTIGTCFSNNVFKWKRDYIYNNLKTD